MVFVTVPDYTSAYWNVAI